MLPQFVMLKKIVASVKMIFISAFVFAYIIAGMPVLIYARISSDPRLALRLTKLLGRIALRMAGIRFRIEGFEGFDPHRGYVFVGNHRSIVDICVIWVTAPGDTRFLAKKELFHVPLISFALRSMGMIEVDRSDREAAAASVDRAVSEIQAGRSIILFPEGTRSRTHHLLPFKKGAFVLAIKAQAPVAPFTVIGADQLLKPDTILLYPGKVRIIFHEPIESTGLALEDRNQLLEQARSVIETTYLKETETTDAQR